MDGLRAHFATPVLVLLVAGQFMLARPMHDWLMSDILRSTSGDWHTLLADLLVTGKRSGDYARLAATIDAGLGSQSLGRVELSNPACDCAISVRSRTERQIEALTERLGDLVAGRLGAGEILTFGVPPATGRGELHEASRADDHAHLSSRRIALDEATELEVTLRINLNASEKTHSWMIRLMGLLATALCAVALFAAQRFVSRSRKAEEMSLERARFLAEHDPLTGLFNRLGFQSRAAVLLESCRSGGKRACLVLVDADNFKEINDLHGHPVGDKAIRAIASLLRGSFPDSALIGRLGGDEFAVLVREAALGDEAEIYLDLLNMTTEFACGDGQQALVVATSAGFAVFPGDGGNILALMQSADLALLSMKRRGKSGVCAYDRSMTDALERRNWEVEGVLDGLRRGDIVPFYQPIVNARTGELEGMEALVRWRHPELGVLTPARFEQALCDPSVSRKITQRMLALVVRDLARWRAAGSMLSAGLNLGEADLKQPGLPDLLSEATRREGLPKTALAIEITETAVSASNLNEVLAMLTEIRARGMFVALDDFGTGASSLTFLKTLPCTSLKIDKSFVQDCLTDPMAMAIVRALTTLGHDMRLKIIAKGVETAAQRDALAAIGIDLMQGYFYARPIPSADTDAYIAAMPVAGPSRASGSVA